MASKYEYVKSWRGRNPDMVRAQRRRAQERKNDAFIARRKRYRARHREEILAKRRSQRLEIVQFIENYKSEHPCFICGEQCVPCLDFHHAGDNKEASISQIPSRMWKLPKIQAEIDKCIVLCSNCHRKLHAGIYLATDPGAAGHQDPCLRISSGENSLFCANN